LFFLEFCGVINQNLLQRLVYIAVSSQKRLLHHFCGKPLHIIFKAGTEMYGQQRCVMPHPHFGGKDTVTILQTHKEHKIKHKTEPVQHNDGFY